LAANVVVPDGHYLMQLRRDRYDIWNPSCWCCFGESVDELETRKRELRYNLHEGLELNTIAPFRYFAQIASDYRRWGYGIKRRNYFEVTLSFREFELLILHEGQAYRLFSAEAVMLEPMLAAYDCYDLRMHVQIGLLR
jgi:hypothetical protein